MTIMISTDLSGMLFGKLTAIEKSVSPNKKIKQTYWRCKCECGRERVVTRSNLTSKNTKSCGFRTCVPKPKLGF